MVYNPRQSQRAMNWCVDHAIGLIFIGINKLNKKLKRRHLFEYLAAETVHMHIPHQDISKMVYELNRRQYIENVDGDSVVLTNKAKIKIIDQVIEANIIDGKFRLVSFDVPEIKRKNRNNFRRAIKRMGFVQVQKSLWVSDRNSSDLVELAAKEYGVADFVAYFIAERSNIDSHITAALANHKKIINEKRTPRKLINK